MNYRQDLEHRTRDRTQDFSDGNMSFPSHRTQGYPAEAATAVDRGEPAPPRKGAHVGQDTKGVRQAAPPPARKA